MKNRQFHIFQLWAVSLVLIAFCYLARATEDVVKSVELKLLWEKTVNFEYSIITTDSNFKRIIGSKYLGYYDSEHYIFLNSTGEKTFEIQNSRYGIGSRKINIYDHPDYVQAKKDETLSKLNLVVNELAKLSTNNRYLGIIQTYYNNKEHRFDRRFKFYAIDEACRQQLLWEKDPICPKPSNKQTRAKSKNYQDWECCINEFSVAKNGNVMLVAGFSRKGEAKRILVYNRNGILLQEVENCSNPMPIVGFSLNNIGEFKYAEMHWGYIDPMKYFNLEGIEIEEEEYHNDPDPEPYNIMRLPFWISQKSSYSDRTMGHVFFTNESGLNIVYMKAKHRIGHYLTLYNIDKRKEIWTFENDKEGYELINSPAISQNGDLILISREKSLKGSFEQLFLNKNGELVGSFNKHGFPIMSEDGKRLFIYNDDGNLEMYSIVIAR